MRIVHTCLRYPPATGGAEKYVQEIVERTHNIQENRDVRVLTSKMKTHGPITELSPNDLLNDPPYVQRLHHAKTPLLSYPRLQALKYYLQHHQPNIVHGYGFWYQPADVAAAFSKKHNLPFIFHPIFYENDIRKKPLWQIYKKTIGYNTFAAADVVAVISPFEQKLIEQSGFSVKRFELIPPGIELKRYDKTTKNIFEEKNITGKILLSVSRLAESKGLNDVIAILPNILKKYPELSYVIVGEDFGAKAELIKQAQDLGIEKNVHFLGKLSEQNLISAYQHANIFIHPSYYEAFGIVLIESLAAKTPIIARNISAIPYTVPNNKAALLFNDQKELWHMIDNVLSSKEKEASLIDNGYQHVLKNYTWDKSIKKLISLYDELITK